MRMDMCKYICINPQRFSAVISTCAFVYMKPKTTRYRWFIILMPNSGLSFLYWFALCDILVYKISVYKCSYRNWTTEKLYRNCIFAFRKFNWNKTVGAELQSFFFCLLPGLSLVAGWVLASWEMSSRPILVRFSHIFHGFTVILLTVGAQYRLCLKKYAHSPHLLFGSITLIHILRTRNSNSKMVYQTCKIIM